MSKCYILLKKIYSFGSSVRTARTGGFAIGRRRRERIVAATRPERLHRSRRGKRDVRRALPTGAIGSAAPFDTEYVKRRFTHCGRDTRPYII